MDYHRSVIIRRAIREEMVFYTNNSLYRTMVLFRTRLAKRQLDTNDGILPRDTFRNHLDSSHMLPLEQ